MKRSTLKASIRAYAQELQEEQLNEVSMDKDDIEIVRDIVKDELAKLFRIL